MRSIQTALFFLLLLQGVRSQETGSCSNPVLLCCSGQNDDCYRGCYCDEACVGRNECCSDYIQTCPPKPAPTIPFKPASTPQTKSQSTLTSKNHSTPQNFCPPREYGMDSQQPCGYTLHCFERLLSRFFVYVGFKSQ